MTVPLILDSSILKQTPKLNSPLFVQLIKYCRIGIFKLYIPEVVEKEYLTWIRQEAKISLQNVGKATESLGKFNDDIVRYDVASMIANSQINSLLEKVQKNWNDFKIKSEAIILPILPGHGITVMESYFNGDIPFKEAKYRLDIPDAFIYCSVQEVLKNYEKVVFVLQDKTFSGRIRSQHIETFDNLPLLFTSPNYMIKEEIFNPLLYDDGYENLINYFKDEITSKLTREIESSSYVENAEEEMFEDMIGDAVEVITDAAEINIDTKSINILAENTLTFNIDGVLIHRKKSEASYNDLKSYDSNRISNLKDKEIQDDGTYKLEEIVTTKFEGVASIVLESSNPLTWKTTIVDNFYHRRFEINEIKVFIESINKK